MNTMYKKWLHPDQRLFLPREKLDNLLSLYSIKNYYFRFIRHNENLVFRINDLEKKNTFILRIHYPKNSGFIGIQQKKGAIESELTWLKALNDNTDLILQHPVSGIGNQFVQQFFVNRMLLNTTLLTWVEGEEFDQEAINAERLVYQLGCLQYKLHEQSKKWNTPPGFYRISYDENLFQKYLILLKKGVVKKIIQNNHYNQLYQCAEFLLKLVHTLERNRENWGLIHADLAGNNLIVKEDTIIPIDFSLSGFGYYFLDLAISAGNLKKYLRPSLLKGYGLKGDYRELRFIEAFFLMIVIISASRNIDNPGWRGWFNKRLPVIADEYCEKFMAGELFLFQ